MKIFISHSSKDKPFVRKLDSALSSQGITVFLDERDIKVGESIPDAIYKAISVSTHVLYVISKNSVNSEWVKEELSIAKMRQKATDGLSILPILLDDIELPTAVCHVKYASFINWQLSTQFIASMNEILISLGVPLKYAEKRDVQFYVKFLQEYSEVEQLISELGGIFEAVQYIPRGVEPYVGGTSYTESLYDISRNTVKYILSNMDFTILSSLCVSTKQYHSGNKETKIYVIDSLIQEFIDIAKRSNYFQSRGSVNRKTIRQILDLLRRISGVMADLKIEVSSIIGSSCDIRN